MVFEYNWQNNEANFGPPTPKQVDGGIHITFEIILKRGDKYIALRRPKGIPEHELPPQTKSYPKGLLYFCHNLIRYGESMEHCVKRIVKDQAGVSVEEIKLTTIFSEVQEKDNQWSVNPTVIAEVEETPATSELITEVIEFDKNTIPDDFAWWPKEELKEFLDEYN